MLTLAQNGAFLLAAVLVTLAPGPDNMMVLALGMARGRRAGMAFGLGCALGCLSHTLLAVAGVSALVAASPTAFTALTLLGGAYLLWLGVMAYRQAGCGGASRPAPLGDTPWRLWLKGVIANAINPKVILFFLSFLPQFVRPEAGPVSLQLAWLGGLFTLQAAMIFVLLGYFAGTLGRHLTRHPRLGFVLDRLAAVVFIVLGLMMVGGVLAGGPDHVARMT